jgi:dihydroneopterin aldolase
MTSDLPDPARWRRHAEVVLRDLVLPVDLGTYGPDDVVPDAHLMDLTLALAPERVEVAADDMALVFDYDPLIARVARIARERQYATQEYLITRIVEACLDHPEILALDITLRKGPVLAGPAPGGSGSLGVRLVLGPADLQARRAAPR